MISLGKRHLKYGYKDFALKIAGLVGLGAVIGKTWSEFYEIQKPIEKYSSIAVRFGMKRRKERLAESKGSSTGESSEKISRFRRPTEATTFVRVPEGSSTEAPDLIKHVSFHRESASNALETSRKIQKEDIVSIKKRPFDDRIFKYSVRLSFLHENSVLNQLDHLTGDLMMVGADELDHYRLLIIMRSCRKQELKTFEEKRKYVTDCESLSILSDVLKMEEQTIFDILGVGSGLADVICLAPNNLKCCDIDSRKEISQRRYFSVYDDLSPYRDPIVSCNTSLNYERNKIVELLDETFKKERVPTFKEFVTLISPGSVKGCIFLFFEDFLTIIEPDEHDHYFYSNVLEIPRVAKLVGFACRFPLKDNSAG